MNRTQRAIAIAGAFVILVLLGVGSWTFTASERYEEGVPAPLRGSGLPVRTWDETSRCSILFGTSGVEAPGRPAWTFGVPSCERYDAWREPIVAAVGATAIMTLLAVLWCATPRPRGDADSDNVDGAEPDAAAAVVSPSSAGPSPRR